MKFSSWTAEGQIRQTAQSASSFVLCVAVLHNGCSFKITPPHYTHTTHTQTQTNREQTHRAFIGNRGCEAQLKTAISHQFNRTNTHSQIIEKRQNLSGYESESHLR